MKITYWTAFWVFIADQATKWIIVHGMDLMKRMVIDVWPPFLTLRMAWNRGVNFGLLADFDARWILVGIALAVSGFVLWWIAREGGGRMAYLSAGLLVGGALGNVIDRILYGAVADFINMSCCGVVNPFAFNLADVGVFLGALGLVFFAGGDGTKQGGTRRKSA